MTVIRTRQDVEWDTFEPQPDDPNAEEVEERIARVRFAKSLLRMKGLPEDLTFDELTAALGDTLGATPPLLRPRRKRLGRSPRHRAEVARLHSLGYGVDEIRRRVGIQRIRVVKFLDQATAVEMTG